MNRKIELSIYIVIFLVFGIVFVDQAPQSKFYLYYTIALWISFGLLLTISRYFISTRISNREYSPAGISFFLSLSIAFVTCAYLYSNYIIDITNLNSISIFEPLILKENLPYLLTASIIGLLNTLKPTRKIILKTIYSTFAILGIGATIFIFKYYNDIKYKGNDSVKFIGENHQTLATILQSQQFTDKVVYIDLWFSSCSPCIKEFKVMPFIKESLKYDNIEYLYLARKTSHPNDIQLWKNAIKKYNLSGWHVYMSDTLEEDVWQLIEENVQIKSRSYPHYLIVNKENDIISYNAYKPSDKKQLINMIKELIRENKEL